MNMQQQMQQDPASINNMYNSNMMNSANNMNAVMNQQMDTNNINNMQQQQVGVGVDGSVGGINMQGQLGTETMSQVSCVYCNTTLSYPHNSLYIQCPKCTHTMNPAAPHASYVNCIGCTTLLSHPPTSLTIQCPKCMMVMDLPSRGTTSPQDSGGGGGGSGSGGAGSSSDPNSKSKSRKKRKDPNAPKRATNAYMIFCKERRNSLREERPDLQFGKIGAKLGEMWRMMSVEEKKPFESRATGDRDRYKGEMGNYQSHNLMKSGNVSMQHMHMQMNASNMAGMMGGMPMSMTGMGLDELTNGYNQLSKKMKLEDGSGAAVGADGLALPSGANGSSSSNPSLAEYQEMMMQQQYYAQLQDQMQQSVQQQMLQQAMMQQAANAAGGAGAANGAGVNGNASNGAGADAAANGNGMNGMSMDMAMQMMQQQQQMNMFQLYNQQQQQQSMSYADATTDANNGMNPSMMNMTSPTQQQIDGMQQQQQQQIDQQQGDQVQHNASQLNDNHLDQQHTLQMQQQIETMQQQQIETMQQQQQLLELEVMRQQQLQLQPDLVQHGMQQEEHQSQQEHQLQQVDADQQQQPIIDGADMQQHQLLYIDQQHAPHAGQLHPDVSHVEPTILPHDDDVVHHMPLILDDPSPDAVSVSNNNVIMPPDMTSILTVDDVISTAHLDTQRESENEGEEKRGEESRE